MDAGSVQPTPTLFLHGRRKRLPLSYFVPQKEKSQTSPEWIRRSPIEIGYAPVFFKDEIRIVTFWQQHRSNDTSFLFWPKRTRPSPDPHTHNTQNQRGRIFTIERNRRQPFATRRQSSTQTKRQFEIRLQFHSIGTSRIIYNSKWTDSCCKGMALDRRLVPSPIGESDRIISLDQTDSPGGECCPLFPSSALFYPHLSLRSMPLFHHPHHL